MMNEGMKIFYHGVIEPCMMILKHNFVVLGYEMDLIDLILLGTFSSIAGWALYRMFGK